MSFEKYMNLIIYLICDGLGEKPEKILLQQEENGLIELEKLDYIQIITKLEAMLDITTGWLRHSEYDINLFELCEVINKINLYGKYVCN